MNEDMAQATVLKNDFSSLAEPQFTQKADTEASKKGTFKLHPKEALNSRYHVQTAELPWANNIASPVETLPTLP